MKLHSILLNITLTSMAFASTVVHHSEVRHWGYSGELSPKNWGKVSPICSNGKLQTPINIETDKVKPLGRDALKFFNYETDIDADVVNNGHTIKVTPLPNESYEAPYITIDGISYKLLQFHMHTHSESTIDGKRSALVAHLVHQSNDGKLAVVAVFFEVGKENLDIKKYWDKMPKHPGETIHIKHIDVAHILPSDTSKYYTFMGSLTTPPCTEGVKWFILKDKQTLSQEQIDKLRELYSHNFRPIQDKNGRDIFER